MRAHTAPSTAYTVTLRSSLRDEKEKREERILFSLFSFSISFDLIAV